MLSCHCIYLPNEKSTWSVHVDNLGVVQCNLLKDSEVNVYLQILLGRPQPIRGEVKFVQLQNMHNMLHNSP